MKKLFLFLITLMSISCSSDKMDSPLKDLVETDIDEILKLEKIVKLSSSEEGLISFPFDFTINGDLLIVASRGIGIKIFDLEGNFLREIGNIGEGPGEFSSISAIFNIDMMTFGIFDPSNSRITIFDLNGNLLKSKILPNENYFGIRHIIYHRKFLFIQVPHSDQFPFNILILNDELESVKGVLSASDMYGGYLYRGLFGGGLALDRINLLIYEMNSFSLNTISQYDLKSGKISNLFLGNYSFYKEIPELEDAEPFESTQEKFNRGTDVLNQFYLDSKFIILYSIFNKSLERKTLFSVLYDAETLKAYPLYDFYASYCDGDFLYDLKFEYAEEGEIMNERNPALFKYSVTLPKNNE